MTGSLAAAALSMISKPEIDGRWLSASIVLAVGVALTFGRGAMLGTAAGWIGILGLRRRRLAIIITCIALAGILLMVAAIAFDIQLPSFIPKTGFSGRMNLWTAGIQNLRVYGLFGIGAGQTESLPG